MNTTDISSPSDKKFLTTGLLALIFGLLGAHRFYLGKIGSGLAQLFTFGGFGIWTIADILMILFGTVKDSDGRIVTKDPKAAKILYGVFGAVVLVAIVAPKNQPRASSTSSDSVSGSSSKEWVATKRNIMGLYHSDRGMGGWGGTCELLFGTYIIKDQMLTNGRMIGEYSLSGDEITFYNNGSTLGVAIVSEGSLNFGPNKCTYVKK
jgi:hypothetical protein